MRGEKRLKAENSVIDVENIKHEIRVCFEADE